MLKLMVGMLAVVLAGSASAAGWRSMRIDASSEDRFDESVTALQDKLPRVRRAVFEQSLQDIWAQGTKAAAGAREYTSGDYLRQVDGLGYKEVVTFTDPTGDTADRYFHTAYANLYRGGNARPGTVRNTSRGASWPTSSGDGWPAGQVSAGSLTNPNRY